MSKKRVLIFLLIIAVFLSFGCTDKKATNISVSNNGTEINVSLPESNGSDWCPVGSQLQVKDPTTGENLSVRVTGTEKFGNKTLCKASVETGNEGNTSRFEYMWSQDKNTTVWTKYDKNGNITMRLISVDGNKTIVDGAGRKLELGNLSGVI